MTVTEDLLRFLRLLSSKTEIFSSASKIPLLRCDDVAALDPNQCSLLVATFNQLCLSQDLEGALELESQMNAIAKTFESSQPRPSGGVHYNLGGAHRCLGREGGIEKATVYYQKAIELAKKAGKEGG